MALFFDAMRRIPARLRATAAHGALEFMIHVRSVDILHRGAILVEGGLEAPIATRQRNDIAAEDIVRARLHDDFESFRRVATNGTMLEGSRRRRRRAQTICRRFADRYMNAPEQFLSVMKDFTNSY